MPLQKCMPGNQKVCMCVWPATNEQGCAGAINTLFDEQDKALYLIGSLLMNHVTVRHSLLYHELLLQYLMIIISFVFQLQL